MTGLLLISGFLTAQHAPEAGHAAANAEEAFHPHHSLSVLIGHTNVREGVREGSKKWLTLPSWGLDYNFIFHSRWAVGLHTDIILEEFLVETHLEGGEEGEVIERNFPMAPALMAMYKPKRYWSFHLGAGMEFTDGDSFFLNRVGVEYSVEIANRWEFLATVQYDFRYNAYDTYMLGIGVAKVFGGHHAAGQAE